MEKLVDLQVIENQIAVVIMQDQKNSNVFSNEFLAELRDIFQKIQQMEELKTVLVHGFKTIFAVGGSQEVLLDLHSAAKNKAGTIEGTPLLEFACKGLLECDVPVIAAMQGHALGGGLVFGLYADMIIAAEERLYNANFMKYGFTPGLGSSIILREKLGANLANEMVYTAKNFFGRQLRERGVSFQVLPAVEVIPAAIQLAREIVDKPRETLKQWKRNSAEKILRLLPQALAEEEAMHEKTFSHPEVKERITKLFGRS